MSEAVRIESDYLQEADVLVRWPMLTAKELRKARKNGAIAFYAFRGGPCYTGEQVQRYINRTYLKGGPCDAQEPTRQPEANPQQRLAQAVPTNLSKLEGSISTGRTATAADSSMPAGMTPELAASAAELLGQQIGQKRKSSLRPLSCPPPRQQTGKCPALVR
jgi:hypothetical protein